MADSLHYLSLAGLLTAVNKNKDNLCTACLTSEYPTQEGIDRYSNQKFLK
jgi:glutamine phosphoribosylpyrophosphate amidotransferase